MSKQAITAQDGTPITMTKVGAIGDSYDSFADGVAKHLASDEKEEAKIKAMLLEESVVKTMKAQAELFDGEYLLAYHRNKTEKCEGVQQYRVNPDGTQDGVGLPHEIKMGVYKKGDEYHVVITTGDHEVRGEVLKGAHLVDAESIGMVPYTINPFNAADALEAVLAKQKKAKVVVHLDDLSIGEAGFVYNNNGNNLFTCATSSQCYLGAINQRLATFKEQFGERVVVDSDATRETIFKDNATLYCLMPGVTYKRDMFTLGFVEGLEVSEAGKDSGGVTEAEEARELFNSHGSQFRLMRRDFEVARDSTATTPAEEAAIESSQPGTKVDVSANPAQRAATQRKMGSRT